MPNLRPTLRRVGGCLLALLLAAVLLAGGVAHAVTLEGTKARFAWIAASGPVDHYQGEVSFDSGATWQSWGTTPDAATTSLVLTASEGQTAMVRVRAVGTSGQLGPWSPTSEPVSFVAVEQPVGEPGVPTVTIVCDEGQPDIEADGTLVCQ